MALQLVTASPIEPITVAEAKLHLRADITDDDSLIEGLITAAREYCETATERAFLTQTWRLVVDSFPDLPSFSASWQSGQAEFQMPKPPLQSVTSIAWKDTTGASTTVAPTDYIVDTASEPGRVVLAFGKSWPSGTVQPVAGVTVTFVAGYDEPSRVPQSIKQALLLLIGHWYESRQAVVVETTRAVALTVPIALESLLWRNRVPSAV